MPEITANIGFEKQIRDAACGSGGMFVQSGGEGEIRYVGIEEQADDGEPFDAKMKRLTDELSGLFAKSHDLESEIRVSLKSIGCEVK